MNFRVKQDRVVAAIAVLAGFALSGPDLSAQTARRFVRREIAIVCCNVPVHDPSFEGLGTDHATDCKTYLPSAPAESRRMICAALRGGSGKVCSDLAGACDGRNGRDCGDPMPDRGFVYSNFNQTGVHSDPSTQSSTVARLPNGIRVQYDEVRRVNGETWYHINPPGSSPGWIRGGDVSCTRPQAPPPARPPNVVSGGSGLAKSSSAQTSAHRG